MRELHAMRWPVRYAACVVDGFFSEDFDSDFEEPFDEESDELLEESEEELPDESDELLEELDSLDDSAAFSRARRLVP